MMETLVLISVLAAVVLVMASGVWVAGALIAAIWHMEPPASSPRDNVPSQER